MTLPSFNSLDGAILVIVGFTVARGAFRGLIREVMGVVVVVGAYALANLVYLNAEPGLRDFIGNAAVSAGLAFALSFVAIALGLMLLFRLGEHGLVRLGPVGGFNHAGGLVLGALKGTLVVAILLFLLGATPDGARRVRESGLAPLFLPVSRALGERFLDAVSRLPKPPSVPLGPS